MNTLIVHSVLIITVATFPFAVGFHFLCSNNTRNITCDDNARILLEDVRTYPPQVNCSDPRNMTRYSNAAHEVWNECHLQTSSCLRGTNNDNFWIEGSYTCVKGNNINMYGMCANITIRQKSSFFLHSPNYPETHEHTMMDCTCSTLNMTNNVTVIVYNMISSSYGTIIKLSWNDSEADLKLIENYLMDSRTSVELLDSAFHISYRPTNTGDNSNYSVAFWIGIEADEEITLVCNGGDNIVPTTPLPDSTVPPSLSNTETSSPKESVTIDSVAGSPISSMTETSFFHQVSSSSPPNNVPDSPSLVTTLSLPSDADTRAPTSSPSKVTDSLSRTIPHESIYSSRTAPITSPSSGYSSMHDTSCRVCSRTINSSFSSTVTGVVIHPTPEHLSTSVDDLVTNTLIIASTPPISATGVELSTNSPSTSALLVTSSAGSSVPSSVLTSTSESTSPTTTSVSPTTGSSVSIPIVWIVAPVAAVVVILVIIIGSVCYMRKRRKTKESIDEIIHETDRRMSNFSPYELEVITSEMTDNPLYDSFEVSRDYPRKSAYRTFQGGKNLEYEEVVINQQSDGVKENVPDHESDTREKKSDVGDNLENV